MKRYNLIDEKWIPVRMLDGRYEKLGIAETLLRAKEIAVIEDPSPLIVASLHRFLLALLYRALEGPTDFDQAKILFKEGLPAEKINSYVTQWRERFWLFDDEYPFFQIPYFEPSTWRAWTTLTAEHNADNAKVLFDHVNVLQAGCISEAQAACGILATQTFALSCGKSELNHTSTAPSATAIMVLPIGYNLEETLIFSLINENRECLRNDLPIWERELETMNALKSGISREIQGFADLYTWRSRSIRFKENSSECIENVAFASGIGHNKSDFIDPMLAYREDAKHGRLPIQFQERGLWRNFDCLLPDDSKLAPQVIGHAIRLSRLSPKRLPQSIMILGQSNNKAKVEFWRMERFILPTALIGEKSIRTDIRRLLDNAEETHKILLEACNIYAKSMLSHGDRELDGKDIKAFVEQMGCNELYWSTLEAQFHRILEGYTLDKDPDAIEYQWLVTVKNTLNDTWNEHKLSVSQGNAWAIRSQAKADSFLLRKLTKIVKTIKEYESKEVR